MQWAAARLGDQDDEEAARLQHKVAEELAKADEAIGDKELTPYEYKKRLMVIKKSQGNQLRSPAGHHIGWCDLSIFGLTPPS